MPTSEKNIVLGIEVSVENLCTSEFIFICRNIWAYQPQTRKDTCTFGLDISNGILFYFGLLKNMYLDLILKIFAFHHGFHYTHWILVEPNNLIINSNPGLGIRGVAIHNH